jgi:hypothetical protein
MYDYTQSSGRYYRTNDVQLVAAMTHALGLDYKLPGQTAFLRKVIDELEAELVRRGINY